MGSVEKGRHSLYEIKDSNSIAYWREEMGAIGTEEQVALAVDGAQQV